MNMKTILAVVIFSCLSVAVGLWCYNQGYKRGEFEFFRRLDFGIYAGFNFDSDGKHFRCMESYGLGDVLRFDPAVAPPEEK